MKTPDDTKRDAAFTGTPTIQPAPPAAPKPAMPPNPFEDIERMNNMSYEEIREHTQRFKDYFEDLAQRQLLKMSPTVKRTFFESLIDVINCNSITPAGATPDQAAAMAWKVIQREDFRFIEEIYPGITEKLRKRQEMFDAWKIAL